ncbi:metal ABC transporter permease [Haloglycomyces albus]|uniref:metal ABC transporter permease n=1 Tax=Haloglycomyces albus TaxID=526067 RepID=UPI0004B48123|nr:metal ABC transporter permease [Haloglycomyces albus]
MSITAMLDYEFMRNALFSALIVGLCAPTVGVFLVQRRLALLGDGLGHVAITGVAVGLITSVTPLWTTLAATILAAIVIELLRTYSKTSGDVALAMMFYGGIAGGVFLTSVAEDKGLANLQSFLFGSLLTTSSDDVLFIAVGGGLVVILMSLLLPWLAAISIDETHARAAGIPTIALNMVLLATAAVVVSVSMRVVGLLLVSALLVIPVVTASQIGRSFRSTYLIAMVGGSLVAGSGVLLAGRLDVPPGATIVLLAIAVFVAVTVVATLGRAIMRRRSAGTGLDAADAISLTSAK